MWYDTYTGWRSPIDRLLLDKRPNEGINLKGKTMTDETEDKVVIKPDTSNYTDTRSSAGSKSQHNGSPVAIALAGMTVDEVKDVADTLGLEDLDRYKHLNAGQQRMNLGNRIRGRIKAIDVENAKQVTESKAEGATKAQVKAATKLVSGEDQLAAAVKPIRKEVDARESGAEKERVTKAKTAADKKAAKTATDKAAKTTKKAA